MDNLKKQLDILIDRIEEKKLRDMSRGLIGDIREDMGQLNAFKLIKLLIETNLSINIDN